MRALPIVLAALGGALALRPPTAPSHAPDAHSPDAHSPDALAARVDTLDRALAALDESLGTRDERRAFRRARSAYKHLEGVLAFYAPPVVAALNGIEAVEDEDDPDRGRVVPRGFQRLEGALFDATGDRDAGHGEVRRMRTFVARFRATLPFVAPDDAQRLEIARLELARVATLGIAGADATLSRDAMRESADALDGVRALVAAMPAAGPFAECLTRAAATLRATPDFDAFDRYAFVTRHATPAFQALAALTARAAPASLAASATLRRTWPLAAANVYDARAFDVMAFAPHDAPRPTPALVALGASLFADPRLSGDGARSCASCHVPTRGFSDGRARARAARDDDTTTLRHTPPIRYAAWQPTQFADARAATLEHQIDSVLASRAEMHGTRGAIDGVAARLAESAADRARFAAATGVPADRAVTPRAVRAALAAYLRTLARFDAPFDRAMRDAMRGDTSGAPLPIAARRGFNVFMGRAGCGTCHFAPLFNGTAPPELVRSSPEVVGVASASDDRVLDPDPGRGAIDRLAGHAHAFRTPTVRDAALGGPYMHNGALRTLDDLLDFYDRGGGAGRGVEVPNQTLSARPLRLTAEERADLVAFLRSLVDTTPPLPFTTTPR